jgi:hypothetical protein
MGSIVGQDAAKAIFFLLIVLGVILKLVGIDAVDEWLSIG